MSVSAEYEETVEREFHACCVQRPIHSENAPGFARGGAAARGVPISARATGSSEAAPVGTEAKQNIVVNRCAFLEEHCSFCSLSVLMVRERLTDLRISVLRCTASKSFSSSASSLALQNKDVSS